MTLSIIWGSQAGRPPSRIECPEHRAVERADHGVDDPGERALGHERADVGRQQHRLVLHARHEPRRLPSLTCLHARIRIGLWEGDADAGHASPALPWATPCLRGLPTLYQISHKTAGRWPYLGPHGHKRGTEPRRVPPQIARCLMIRPFFFSGGFGVEPQGRGRAVPCAAPIWSMVELMKWRGRRRISDVRS